MEIVLYDGNLVILLCKSFIKNQPTKMAKVKTVQAPIAKVAKGKVETEKVVEAKKIEVKKELTFEDRVKISVEFQEKKRAAKAVSPEAFKAVQAEERKWLESVGRMLEVEFKKNGFMYKLVKRGEKSLIYAQHNIEGTEVDEKPCAFEVFLSKISSPKIAFKKPYEAYEMFPGNGVFGSWAWACQTLDRAEARFVEFEKGTAEVIEVENDEDEDESED